MRQEAPHVYRKAIDKHLAWGRSEEESRGGAKVVVFWLEWPMQMGRLACRRHARSMRDGFAVMAPVLLLLAVLSPLALTCAAAQAPPGAAAADPVAPVEVSSPAELLAAINDGSGGVIHLMKPMVLPTGWGPARPARPLLILSPYRVILDWCDADCLVSPF